MNSGKTVFSQIMDYMPMYEFRKCVNKYNGNYHTSSFTCMDQFLCMAFAQLTYRESLRDIEACLRSRQERLYHLGIRGRMSRSTLADANEKRDWRIYADFAQVLIRQAQELYINEPFRLELDQTVYALDATMIDLCLSLFPWAHFCKTKGAVKLHTLLDLRGSIPTIIFITHGKVADVKILDDLPMQAGALYIMDRGYQDYGRLFKFHLASAFFVIRVRKDFKFKRIYSQPIDKSTGLQCDQIVRLGGYYAKKDYPEKLRRIRFYDKEQQKRFVFLTNNFTLSALTIAQLYKCRWQIEIFFKWIKQHLRIKAFYGTSENAVKIQIWIAISVYVLVAIIRKQLQLDYNLYTILQILSVTPFEKVPLDQLFANFDYEIYSKVKEPFCNQLNLFDY